MKTNIEKHEARPFYAYYNAVMQCFLTIKKYI